MYGTYIYILYGIVNTSPYLVLEDKNSNRNDFYKHSLLLVNVNLLLRLEDKN